MANTKIVRRYAHASSDEFPDDLWPIGPGGPREEDYDKFVRADNVLYEIALDIEYDMETGNGRIIALNGKKVEE